MSKKLEGKVAVITGGNSGMELALPLRNGSSLIGHYLGPFGWYNRVCRKSVSAQALSTWKWSSKYRNR